jgi:hypothetical protein
VLLTLPTQQPRALSACVRACVLRPTAHGAERSRALPRLRDALS